MKNKNVLIVISVVLVFVLVLILFLVINKKSILSVHQAGNFVKTDVTIPNFEIKVGGIVNTTITKEVLDVNGVNLYEFDAYTETNWGNFKNKYVGYKMADILKIFNNQSYKSVSATNIGGVKITYPLSIIENVYIVFFKDGEKIGKGDIAIISVSDSENYSIENIVRITLDATEVK